MVDTDVSASWSLNLYTEGICASIFINNMGPFITQSFAHSNQVRQMHILTVFDRKTDSGKTTVIRNHPTALYESPHHFFFFLRIAVLK